MNDLGHGGLYRVYPKDNTTGGRHAYVIVGVTDHADYDLVVWDPKWKGGLFHLVDSSKLYNQDPSPLRPGGKATELGYARFMVLKLTTAFHQRLSERKSKSID